MKRACITGGAGFIGSNLADRLLERGVEVVILDDFSTGRREFLAAMAGVAGMKLIEGDVLDMASVEDAMDGCDWVFHLQANADLRRGLEHPQRDLRQNTIATSTVLEAMRARGVSQIVFGGRGTHAPEMSGGGWPTRTRENLRVPHPRHAASSRGRPGSPAEALVRRGGGWVVP